MEFLWAFDDSIYFDIVPSFPWYFFTLANLISGSNLVDIQSRSENSFISNLTLTDFWTGGALVPESGGSWEWEGGAAWSWSGWEEEQELSVLDGCLSVEPGQFWDYERKLEQAWTELCQAQGKLKHICLGSHGHIGSNQINQNVEPKTFFLKGESHIILQK